MSQLQTVGQHKTYVYTSEEYTRVKYHNTDVVTFNPDQIILDSGGCVTATTRIRMNQASNQFNLGYKVYQKAFDWFVQYKGSIYPFQDGMILNKDYSLINVSRGLIVKDSDNHTIEPIQH